MIEPNAAHANAARAELHKLFELLAGGSIDVGTAIERSRSIPSDPDVGSIASSGIRVDHDRESRCGFPEVVYGASKTTEEIVEAVRQIFHASGRVLATRVNDADADAIVAHIPEANVEHHARARCVSVHHRDAVHRSVGSVLVLSAGTSDIPVAEEARVTAWMTECHVEAHYDVGVAGLHRLLDLRPAIDRAKVIVVVAGMDGALPSVVAGLASCPVIGVPTSVGYGAAFGGVAPLLSMLNSCAAGLAVVNIDAGFSAGMLAAKINLASSAPSPSPADESNGS